MRLESAAAAAGGRAELVLGNHEVMNLVGELGYVSPDDFAAYAAEESAAERAAAWERFRTAHAPGVDDALAAEFAKLYPPGFFGQRAAFATRGTLGAWLLRQPVLLVLGDTAFVHGGLPAELGAQDAASINARYAATLRDYLSARDRCWPQACCTPRTRSATTPRSRRRSYARPRASSGPCPRT